MKTMVVMAAAVAAAGTWTLFAADPQGIAVWPSSALKGYTATLAPKVDEKKLALEHLGQYGNHAVLVAHRQGDGEAELHEGQVDFFVVQEGRATLVLGGRVEDGKTTAPGEVRGPSIEGGQRHAVAAGDVVHIPARTPHQLLVPEGTRFTYLVIKVDAP